MSTSPQPERRRTMDGPVRRAMVPPIAPGSDPNGSEVEATPARLATATAPPLEAPSATFEYHKPRRRRHWVRYGLLGVVAVVLLGGGWVAASALLAAHNIIARSNGGAPALAGNVDVTKLKGEGDGRINILVLGIGGAGHDGANLSDTIMVMSIDPKTKNTAMLSVPRDLYVKIPATGNYQTQYGKINAANSYGGPDLATKVVQGIVGVPIHYYVLVDFSGFRQAIDAVGGIDINVPTALYDPEFPCDNDRGYCPLSIKAGPQHMTGTVALRYARCRHGVCGGDFGRAARQQQVLSALKTKSMQLSTLTNPVKLVGLINALGSHVKTDMQVSEMKKLATIVKDIDTTKITNKVLDYGKPDSLLVDATGQIAGAGSIELPKLGNFNYADIQDFVKNIFIDHYITDENARLEVQNGSGITGLGAQVVASLKAAHYNVADPVNADGSYNATVIYDYTNGKKPYTIKYLENRFGVKSQRMTAPSVSPSPNGGTAPEIRIIVGSDYKRSGSSN